MAERRGRHRLPRRVHQGPAPATATRCHRPGRVLRRDHRLHLDHQQVQGRRRRDRPRAARCPPDFITFWKQCQLSMGYKPQIACHRQGAAVPQRGGRARPAGQNLRHRRLVDAGHAVQVLARRHDRRQYADEYQATTGQQWTAADVVQLRGVRDRRRTRSSRPATRTTTTRPWPSHRQVQGRGDHRQLRLHQRPGEERRQCTPTSRRSGRRARTRSSCTTCSWSNNATDSVGAGHAALKSPGQQSL